MEAVRRLNYDDDDETPIRTEAPVQIRGNTLAQVEEDKGMEYCRHRNIMPLNTVMWKYLTEMSDAMKGRSDLREVVLEATESPFVLSIEKAENPKDFQYQKLDPYRGTTDPLEYLKYLKRMMISMRASKDTMCQLFSALMVEAARPWFDGLTPRSIVSYDDLYDKFLVAFSILKKRKKVLLELQEVKQGMTERLSTYLTRFARAAREVDASDDDILMALHNG